MKVVTRLFFIDEEQEKFFGEGPYRLLRAVEEKGSLRSAAADMGMAYSKAIRIIHKAEAALGYSLTDKTVGGKTGGGSVLTEEGKVWLEKYEAYRDACVKVNQQLYQEFFYE